jgi:segregation and condensation protein B
MSYRENYQTVVEKMRSLWGAITLDRIMQTMSQLDPTRKVDVKQNGNGAEPGADTLPRHGGAADGLPVAAPPVAAPRIGPAETGAGDAQDQAGDGNGAGWAALKTTVEFEPEADAGEELALPAGDELVGLTTVLESLLFVAGEPVESAHLAKSLDLPPATVEKGLARLGEQYKARAGGLRLQVHKGRYQLVTAPVTARFVEDFLNVDFSTKLSSAALETLAIVAYRQPVTRVQIEAIRGVDCSGVLRSLVVRGLIEETGRLDAVGRPILYGVTDLFMQHFGLMALDDLPPLANEDADLLHAATVLAEDGDDLLAEDIAEDSDFLASDGPAMAGNA